MFRKKEIHNEQTSYLFYLHPRKSTWKSNKMEVCKTILLFKWVIFRCKMLICQGVVGVVSSPGGEFYPFHLALQVPPALSVPQARVSERAWPIVEPRTFQLPMTIQTTHDYTYYLMFQILEKRFVFFWDIQVRRSHSRNQ